MIVEPSKSYGKVGVIFKRKRSMVQSSNEVNIQPSSNHSAKEKNDKSPRRPCKTRLIGWDHELCRPLYVHSPQMINQEFSLQSPNDTTNHRNIAVLNDKMHVDKLKNNEASKRKGNNAENYITKLKSIRSYSIRNKLKGRKLSATASAVLEEHCTSSESLVCNTNTERVSEGLDSSTLTQPTTESSSDENDDSIEKLLCTPPPSKSCQSICSVLGSDVAKSPIHSNEFNYRTSSPNDALFLSPNKKIVKLLPREKSKSKRVRANKDELSNNDILSSDPNLLNTKAYFDQLDATSLTFDRREGDVSFSDIRQATTSRCIRSTRRLNLLDSSLLEHYESYKQASKDSGVTPIKLIDFAKDRSNYYLEKGICEGFMEEE